MKKLHNCKDCGFNCDDHCSVRYDKDDNMLRIYNKPTDCPMFIQMPEEDDI